MTNVFFSFTMKKTNNLNAIDEPRLVWLRHFSAGICAGAVSRTCTAPIDRLRTFFQGYFFLYYY